MLSLERSYRRRRRHFSNVSMKFLYISCSFDCRETVYLEIRSPFYRISFLFSFFLSSEDHIPPPCYATVPASLFPKRPPKDYNNSKLNQNFDMLDRCKIRNAKSPSPPSVLKPLSPSSIKPSHHPKGESRRRKE